MTEIEDKRKELKDNCKFDIKSFDNGKLEGFNLGVEMKEKEARKEFLDKSIQMINHLIGRFEDIRLTNNLPYLKNKKKQLEQLKQSLGEKS